MLKAMVIFRGLKKVANMNKTHREVFVTVSKSGSMDTSLAKVWLDEVFSNRGPSFF